MVKAPSFYSSLRAGLGDRRDDPRQPPTEEHGTECPHDLERQDEAVQVCDGDQQRDTKDRRRAQGGNQKGQAFSESGGASQKPSGLMRSPGEGVDGAQASPR